MPSIGVNTAILKDEQILLTRREDYDVWCLPGGNVEANESVSEAAIRETIEETGLLVKLTRLVGVYSEPGWASGGMHSILFIAKPVGGELLINRNEVLEARYFSTNELPEPILWWHYRRILDAISGVGGGVVWKQETRWGFRNDMDIDELYKLIDESDYSKREFYFKHFHRDDEGREGLEVGDDGDNT